MFQRLGKDIKDWFKGIDKKTLLIYVIIYIVSALILGTLIRFLIENLSAAIVS